jgi:hypothetical protein
MEVKSELTLFKSELEKYKDQGRKEELEKNIILNVESLDESIRKYQVATANALTFAAKIYGIDLR